MVLEAFGRNNQFVSNFLDVSDLIEYRSVLLNIFLTMFLSWRSVITWTLLHLTRSCWIDIASIPCWNVFGSFILMISSVYFWESMILNNIVCSLVDILHGVIFTVLCNNTNRSSSWWKISSATNDKGVIWEINFQCLKGGSISNSRKFRTWQTSFTKFTSMFINFFIWTIFEFFWCVVPTISF